MSTPSESNTADETPTAAEPTPSTQPTPSAQPPTTAPATTGPTPTGATSSEPPAEPEKTSRLLTTMDLAGRIRITHGGALTAALFRIGMGLLYLWAFVAQGFGISYSNVDNPDAANPTYSWNFSVDSSNGWISSGFKHSPSAGFVSGTHGPLAFIPQNVSTGFADFAWMFAIGGLGIALTLGIFMGIAGWGGFLLNIIIWFSSFPPSSNPLLDGEHMAFALGILLLMFLQAGNYLGFGRPWRRHTPRLLH